MANFPKIVCLIILFNSNMSTQVAVVSLIRKFAWSLDINAQPIFNPLSHASSISLPAEFP